MQTTPVEQYKPKDNHPWRRYKNKPKEQEENVVPKASIKQFLMNLGLNYDTYKVDVDDVVEGHYQALSKLPDEKVAAWLISFLKRNWLSSSKEAIVIE